MPSSIFNRPITVICPFFSLKLPSPYEIGYCQRTFWEGFECNFKDQTEWFSKHCRLRKAGLIAQEGWDSGFLFLISLISFRAKASFESNPVKSRQHGNTEWIIPPTQNPVKWQLSVTALLPASSTAVHGDRPFSLRVETLCSSLYN